MRVITKRRKLLVPRSVTSRFRDYIRGDVETTRDWVNDDLKPAIRSHFRKSGIWLTNFELI